MCLRHITTANKQQLPAGKGAMQKGLVPTAWLTGPLPTIVWWLQLSPAMCAGSVATWRALIAALHALAASSYTAHLPTKPATCNIRRSQVQIPRGICHICQTDSRRCCVQDEHCHCSCMLQLRACRHIIWNSCIESISAGPALQLMLKKIDRLTKQVSCTHS